MGLFSSFLIQADEQQSLSTSDMLSSIEQRILSEGYQPVALDFSSWYEEVKDNEYLTIQEINRYRKQIAQLDGKSVCEKLRTDNILFQLNLIEHRSRLVKTLSKTSSYAGVMSNLDDGKAWYLHWLNAWLALEKEGMVNDAHIAMLKSIAYSELEKVASKYRDNIKSLGQAKNEVLTTDQIKIIEAKLKEKEKKVQQALSQILPSFTSIPELIIAKSSLPDSFPAPGIYDGRTRTFYYHFTDSELPVESLDWLYLHEGVPGHHYQASYVQQKAMCPNSNFSQATYVTEEGWGAYVETLGKSLGLYQDLASETYAQEWQILRALRVLIDIGIHYENWSDKDAMQLWNQYLPNRQSIGKREIARIKRWPVQVITYVYGKAKIEEVIESARRINPEIELSDIHQTILSLSNYPISQFKELIEFNLSKKEPVSAL